MKPCRRNQGCARDTGVSGAPVAGPGPRLRRFLLVCSCLAAAAILSGPAGIPFGPPAALAQPKFPKATGYVNDFAGVLDPGVRGQLETVLGRIDSALGVQLAIAVVPDLGGDDVADYANRLFEAWKIGNRQTNRGLLLVDAVAERKVWVEVGYGLEGALNDAKVGGILDQDVVPYLKQGRREAAYLSAARALMRPILEEQGRNPDSIDSLLSAEGYRVRPASRQRPRGIGLFPIFIFIIVIMSLFRSRRRRGLWWMGGMPWGGFGGFGGFGGGGFGGGGGGFGGFGGGASGGGGAGRGY